MSLRHRIRIRHGRFKGVVVDPPVATDHPRIWFTPDGVTALRSTLASDDTLRGRWQTAASQIGAANSTFNAAPNDSFMLAFISGLMAVRQSDDDLGVTTWAETWQDYVDHCLDVAINVWAQDGNTPAIAIGQALIYDNLYPVMTPLQRTTLGAAVEAGWTNNSFTLGTSVEVYDNGSSEEFFAKCLCGLASDDAADRITTIYDAVMRVVDTNDWMGYGFGLGREFHEGYPSRWGLPILLHALVNTGVYEESETVDHFLTHLRDTWHLCTQAIIPHPSASSDPGKYHMQDKFHTQDPDVIHHRKRNLAADMVWALQALPGKVSLGASGMSDQATLATSEDAYFGYLRAKFDETVNGSSHRRVLDVTQLCNRFTNSSFTANFWAWPAWLVHNLQEYTSVSHADAGIPHVRRFWPGTLDWTFIESDDFAATAGSVIRYRHRKYGASQYEEGCRQNGSWTVHRDGPLLVQRGETGHSSISRRATWAANGAVTFFDSALYSSFAFPNSDNDDSSYQRAVSGSGNYKDQILGNSAMDYGDVTGWYADSRVVAISSDLVRSYNSTDIQTGSPATNEAKVSAFTREFIAVRRGGDGTTREKIFTYDRIALTDTKFQPRYNLCPAMDPDIDGTEAAVTPHGPEQSDAGFNWYADGPTRWNYTGATRLQYDNVDNPPAPIDGNGKVQVTWLEPSGADVTVQKSSGINCVSEVSVSRNAAPSINPWGGWIGTTDAADGWPDDAEKQPYVGMYGVAVSPTDVSAWDADGGHFLVACEVMAAADTPATAETQTCDAASVAARVGASAVVFGKDAGTRSSGSVTVSSGVTLITLVNLTPNTTFTLTPTTLTVASAERLSSSTGVLVVETNGAAGTLAWAAGSSAVMTHFMGIGGVSDGAATYRARADRAATIALEYSTNSALTGSTTTAGVSVVEGDDYTGGETVSGLNAATTYYYSIKVDGVRQHSAPFPSFTTFPTAGVDANVTVVFSSCQTAPDDGCFTAAGGDGAALVMQLGDRHYGDTNVLANQRAQYQAQYVLSSDFMDSIVTTTPCDYIWDDHDYGGNNEDGDLANKANSLQAFKEYTPTYTLANPTNGLWHSFTLANAEFFVLDVRYQREGSKERFPSTATFLTPGSGSGGTTLIIPSGVGASTFGKYAKWYAKFEDNTVCRVLSDNYNAGDGTHNLTLDRAMGTGAFHLRNASMLDMNLIEDGQTSWLIANVNASTRRWKFIVSPVMWNRTYGGSDTWGGWDADQMERLYILQGITADNVIMLSGDRHVSAIDDGTNSDWPELSAGPFSAQSFNATGSTWSGGLYSSGPSYGVVEISATQVVLRVRDANGNAASGITPYTVEAA